ncbi:MAG: MotA/TolQ/ExbB proton channel family protein [Pseudomonadota bacterium]
MQIMAVLKTFIYLIASSMFMPVLLILSGLFIWMLVYSGTFFKSWLQRRQLHLSDKDRIIDLPEHLLSGTYQDHFPGPVSNRIKTIEKLAQEHDPVAMVNLLRDTEHQMWSSLDRLKIIIRIGPGLGLIGTLIPMGTGLASLGQGDLAQLSQDLVVAFTTTVVGMALGLLAYFYFTIQRRWMEQDIKNIELAAELLCEKQTKNHMEKAS